MTNLVPTCFFLDAFCINHTPMSPATKAIKVHVCSATNPMALPKKPKKAPSIGNTSTAFPASHFSASANLFNYFFKTPSSFDGELPVSSPPSKAPVIASAIIKIVIECLVRIENMVIPCSQNKVRIFLQKIYSYQKLLQGFV